MPVPQNVMIIFWIVAAVLFLIVEAATVGLASIWFALGALAALVCALLKGPLWLQILWFFVISVVTLLATRPLAKRYVNGRRQATNADRCIGAVAVVTQQVENIAGTGAVQLDGKFWTARSATGEGFPVGARVTVTEIQGVKLLVRLDDSPPASP